MMDTTVNHLRDKEENVGFGSYLSTLKKYRLVILLLTTLTAVVAFFLVQSTTPVYRATAVLLIEAQQQKAVSIEEIVGIDTSKKEYYLTQFEILKSNQIAEHVIDKLDLASLPEFNGQGKDKGFLTPLKAWLPSVPFIQTTHPEAQTTTTPAPKETLKRKILATFKDKLTIAPIRNTQLVNISFESEDPILAAHIANEVGNSYIQSNLESRLSITSQTSDWLRERLNELKQQLVESEARLSNFMQQEGLIDFSGINGLASVELTDLTNQLSAARDRRIAAESLSYLLNKNKSADVTSLSSVSEISNNPQLRDIRLAEIDAEKRVSELSKRYGPKHDKMIQAQAQLTTIQQHAKKLLTQLAKGLDKERQAALQQEASLNQALNDKKDEYQQLIIQEAKYDALKRDVESNRQLYNLFLNRQKETDATSNFKATNARFSDYALPPLQPATPQKAKTVAIAAMTMMVLTMILAMMLESFRSTIEKPDEIEDKLNLQALGALPRIKSRKYRKNGLDAHLFFDAEQQAFTESVRTIRTSLRLQLLNQSGKRIAVTSSIPEEGKTTTSINLAVAMGTMEKVLLIDCDLRKPAIGTNFGLSKDHPGLINTLAMGVPLEACLYHDDESGIDILTAGGATRSPQELLGSEQFTALLASLETKYDRIVIDTPPVLVVSDALIIGQQTGSAVMVVKAGTKLKQVQAAIAKITKHNIPVRGVVLNQVDRQHTEYDDYYDKFAASEQQHS
ncbi:polysaccharide biosynthesis tyrosine autokinase [Photobacterium sp. MCCC 1A19761]|uniref:GumC family protein n=1 Tax=Photobacterium sp. MCCC 1A19761 TaxID=3115000 RepID=UPI00307F305B